MLVTLLLTTVHWCTVAATATTTALVLPGREVTRDYFGDIFRMRDCVDGLAPRSRCDRAGSRLALEIPGRPCFCQCAPSHFTYRDDKAQCVKEIRECYMSVFFRPYAVEAIPLVFLPTSGQLVHPDAHLSLAGRRRPPGSALPRCKATVSQFMTPEGWRTITREKGGPIFSLFQDGNKTFLQFLGNAYDRQTLQQRLVLVRMFCKIPNYSPFETCVAIRVGYVPGAEPLSTGEEQSKSNMIVVGLSLGVLGMVYVLAVLIYLKLRRRVIMKANAAAKAKSNLASQEQGNRMDPSKRLELYHTHSLGRRKALPEIGEGLRCWKPLSLNETYNRNWTDGPGQLGCEFDAQEFQLRPEHFEPEVLASPPQPVIEYLERLQTSMTYARHRLRLCSRYQPTLNKIPEEDYYSKELPCHENEKTRRTTPDGVSSSSNASTVENVNSPSRPLLTEKKVPKVPPRKPRRKSVSSESSMSCCRESNNSSETEDEKNQIKCAMDTLNDTLEAIEYDIFQQDVLDSDEHEKTRDENLTMNMIEEADSINPKLVSPTFPTDEESDGKEMDTSTCSSLSVVTVLSKDPKLPPINKINFNRTKHSKHLLNFDRKPDSKDLTLDAGSNKSVKISNIKEPPKTTSLLNKTSWEATKREVKPNTEEKSEDDVTIEIQSANDDEKPLEASGRTPSDGAETNSFSSVELELSGVSITSECGCSDEKTSTSESSSAASTATDMTLDSLESQPEKVPVSVSSLLEMWLTKLAEGSLRGREPKRKSKEGKHSWDHVCRKKHRRSKRTREPCPVHDAENHSILVDKLAHYGSETVAGYDVSSYFQALKRDVLREHLMSGWLTQNRDRAHRVPLVTQDDDSLPEPCDSGFRSSPNHSAKNSESSSKPESEGPLRTSSPKTEGTVTPPIVSVTKLPSPVTEIQTNTNESTENLTI